MKKIAVVTGTRAEYGYLKPLMTAIKKDKDLQLMPIVTGMHLLSDFGNTYQIVEKDFPKLVKIDMPLRGDHLKDMADYLAIGIKNFTEYFNNKRPDMIIVLGDRSESLAASLAALYLNIPIAHINGGDVTGFTIDESIRHAITKIAHIHFTHTKLNAERIKKMGEEEKRIFFTGALTLDTILNKKVASKDEIFKKYNLNPNKTTFLVVQHPITTIDYKGYSDMKELFLALEYLKEQTIVIYPNCDAGSKKLIDLIESYKGKDYIHIFKNLAHEDYLGLMKSVEIMIGNSSSGIIEAPSFMIPVINIGKRQQGREKSENIINVEPDKNKILKAIDYALKNKDFQGKVKRCKNRFGNGNAAQKIVKKIKEIKIDDELIQKKLTY